MQLLDDWQRVSSKKPKPTNIKREVVSFEQFDAFMSSKVKASADKLNERQKAELEARRAIATKRKELLSKSLSGELTGGSTARNAAVLENGIIDQLQIEKKLLTECVEYCDKVKKDLAKTYSRLELELIKHKVAVRKQLEDAGLAPNKHLMKSNPAIAERQFEVRVKEVESVKAGMAQMADCNSASNNVGKFTKRLKEQLNLVQNEIEQEAHRIVYGV